MFVHPSLGNPLEHLEGISGLAEIGCARIEASHAHTHKLSGRKVDGGWWRERERRIEGEREEEEEPELHDQKLCVSGAPNVFQGPQLCTAEFSSI